MNSKEQVIYLCIEFIFYSISFIPPLIVGLYLLINDFQNVDVFVMIFYFIIHICVYLWFLEYDMSPYYYRTFVIYSYMNTGIFLIIKNIYLLLSILIVIILFVVDYQIHRIMAEYKALERIRTQRVQPINKNIQKENIVLKSKENIVLESKENIIIEPNIKMTIKKRPYVRSNT
jgi:hypothetical protein